MRRDLDTSDLRERQPQVAGAVKHLEHGGDAVVGVAERRKRALADLPRERRGLILGVGQHRDALLRRPGKRVDEHHVALHMRRGRQQELGKRVPVKHLLPHTLGDEQIAVDLNGEAGGVPTLACDHVELLACALVLAGKRQELEENTASCLCSRAFT